MILLHLIRSPTHTAVATAHKNAVAEKVMPYDE